MRSRSILDRPKVLDKILGKEIESVNQSRELAFTICNDGRLQDHPTTGKWNKITIPGYDPGKTCGKKGSSIFHTHVVLSAMPSLTDVDGYGREFSRHPSLKRGCSVGVDGIFCIGKNGKITVKEFTPDQEQRLLDSTKITKWRGDQVFCDKITEGEETLYACTMQEYNKKEHPMGIFKEVSMHGGSIWSGDEQSDISLFSPLPSMKIHCFGLEGGSMQLSCIARDSRPR